MQGIGQDRTTRRRGSVVLGIAIVTATLVGCAATPTGGPARVMQPGDFKLLAGTWMGSTDQQGALSVPIQGVIQDTGAFYIAPRGGTGGQTPGMMRIVDGGVVYESPTSKGTMTFHESATGWVWKWQGTATDGSAVRHELTKAK
jgi:hypothetical protein